MYDFIIKKKKVVLDCFTQQEYAYNYAKIDHGSKFYPDWWKKTPNYCDNHDDILEGKSVTIKHCTGFTDYYNRAVIIPSWFSLKLHVKTIKEKRFNWQSSNEDFHELSHSKNQFDNFCLDDGFNFKIGSPWRFKTKNKVSFVWSDPVWSNRQHLFDYSVLPAVIDFRNQHSTNISLFLKFDLEPKSIFIDALQPLVALHPMFDYDLEIKNHLVSEKEYKSIDDWRKLLIRNLTNFNELNKYRKNRIKILDKKEMDDGE